MRYQTRPGEYRHPIVFQKKITVSDGMGAGGNFSWEDSISSMAAIWPLKAKDVLDAMKEDHIVTHRIRTRYSALISPHMRIKKINRIFEIVSMRNIDEANLEIEFLAKEIVV